MKKLFLFALFAALCCSCTESGTDDDPDQGQNDYSNVEVTGISLNYHDLTFSSAGGEKTVAVSISLVSDSGHYIEPEWKLTGGASWCTPSRTSGVSSNVVTFTASENNSDQERNATFTFSCGRHSQNLVVTQKSSGSLTVTTSKIEMGAAGGEAVIEVMADIDYTYEIDSKCKGWITYKGTRAVQTSRLVFNVAANSGKEKREGRITIRGGGRTETVTIYQAGETPTIVLTQNKYEVSAAGETIKVEINSNVDFTVSIPSSASWIEETGTRAFSTHTKYFTISPNTTTSSRSAEITFKNTTYNLTEKVVVNQAELSISTITVHVPKKGTLAAVLDEKGLNAEMIVSLKITGELNDEDFITIRSMPNLKDLDLSEVNLPTLFEKVFHENKKIEKIILPSTLTTIGQYAFYDCTSLQTVTFEKGSRLKTIEESAFEDCTELTSIEIPASVETIEDSAFKGCSKLATVTFEKGSQLKAIWGGYYAYSTRYSAYSYYYGAFSDCTALTSIEIPASVETIKSTAFQGCSSLATVTFEKGSKLKTIGGSYASYDAYYYGAFSDCTALTSIEIPASVETIEAAAFMRCSKLATVTFEKGSKLKTIGGGYSSSVSSATTTAYSYYYGAFSDCTALTSIEIPASVETIKSTAFQGCSSLATVTFEKGSKLKTIGGSYASYDAYYYGAFSDCTALTSIEIPASVETIEAAAFMRCSKLATVTFEKGSKLKTIGGSYASYYYGAFSNCTALTSIEIPASVETIKAAAFMRCSKLATVTFEKGSKLKTIDGYAFSCCWALTTVDMSACTQVTEIGYRAFYEDSKLQLFKIGTRTPPSCGDNAFWGINSYSVLKVPAGCVDAYKKAIDWNEFTTIPLLLCFCMAGEVD